MCGGAAAVCGGVVGCGAAGDMGTEEQLVQLPAVVDGSIRLELSGFPMLQTVGNGLVGEAAGMAEPLAIARDGENTFFATRAVCTHMTCTLRFNQLTRQPDVPLPRLHVRVRRQGDQRAGHQGPEPAEHRVRRSDAAHPAVELAVFNPRRDPAGTMG